MAKYSVAQDKLRRDFHYEGNNVSVEFPERFVHLICLITDVFLLIITPRQLILKNPT
jgi:hypothetical protein